MPYDWKKEREKYMVWKNQPVEEAQPESQKQQQTQPATAVPVKRNYRKIFGIIVLVVIGLAVWKNMSSEPAAPDAGKTKTPSAQPAQQPSVTQNDGCPHPNLESRLEHGAQLHDKEEYEKAYAYHFLPAAKQDNPVGCYFCALYMLEGIGGAEKNPKKAIGILNVLADEGFAPAEYILFMMYYQGEYLEKDQIKAVQYLKRAAQHGYEPAQEIVKKLEAAGVDISKFNISVSGAILKTGLSGAQLHIQPGKLKNTSALKQFLP